jgi:hypothetical protein
MRVEANQKNAAEFWAIESRRISGEHSPGQPTKEHFSCHGLLPSPFLQLLSFIFQTTPLPLTCPLPTDKKVFEAFTVDRTANNPLLVSASERIPATWLPLSLVGRLQLHHHFPKEQHLSSPAFCSQLPVRTWNWL